jgi:hypothetical protein
MAIKVAAAGVGIALVGGVGAFYASTLPLGDKYRRPLQIGGIAAVGLGAALLAFSLPSAIDEVKAELVGTRNAGGALGIIGKLIFGQAPAGEITSQRQSTADVSQLGRAKNVLGLVGRFLSPRAGDYIDRTIFSGTYEVQVAVANVGRHDVSDSVRVVVDETPALQPDGHASADSSIVDLIAGDHEQLIGVRVPVALGVTVPFETIPVTLRLYVSGYLLDKVEITRE